MKDYESTEIAYKNGYRQGKKDAEEAIVRCKDCVFLWEYSDTYKATVEHAIGDCSIRCMNGCEEQFAAVAEDDYCSLARRTKKDATD